MNIFERAARAKLRFTSPLGELSTEQLFDLPLSAVGNKASLDGVARKVYTELKDFDAISFVETKPEPRKVQLELQLEIVKHIIESKKSDAVASETRAKNADLRRQLTEVLAKKQGEQLESLSAEEIQKRLADLAG